MRVFFASSALAGLLGLAAAAGCASGVKLDAPPIEDRTGVAVSPNRGAVGGGAGGAGAGSAASGQGVLGDALGVLGSRDVPTIDAGKSANKDRPGPAGDRVIYFDYDSFIIRQEFQALLEVQARYLKADSSRKLAIEGHTDERGGREYNLALGQKRAEAVRRALGLLGVADAQLEAVSFGKEKPAATGVDEPTLAQNRRAELTY